MNKSIKLLTLMLAMVLTINVAQAQKDKSKRPSPPAQAKATVNGADIVIDYSQPAKKDREIFGKLVPYGKVWRTGANENTWISVSKDVKVQGKTLPAGKYGLHTIPGKDEWTIIFNSVSNEWGSYNYDKSKDVLRVTAKPTMTDKVVERFTIDADSKGNVSMAWDKTKVMFTIK